MPLGPCESRTRHYLFEALAPQASALRLSLAHAKFYLPDLTTGIMRLIIPLVSRNSNLTEVLAWRSISLAPEERTVLSVKHCRNMQKMQNWEENGIQIFKSMINNTCLSSIYVITCFGQVKNYFGQVKTIYYLPGMASLLWKSCWCLAWLAYMQ